MKVHVQLDSPPGAGAARSLELAETGAAGLFTFEGQHDVFFPLVEAASSVDLDLMTNVAIAFPRSPMHLANSANDLQLLSRGRFRLGLGSQIKPHIEKRYSATWSRPAARMKETVSAIKAILAAWENTTPLNFRGEFFTHTLMPPTFDPGPNPYGPPPILMGALGPIMTRTAAEVADGLLVMPFHTERHFLQRTLPAVDAGLRESGRARTEFAIIPQIIVGVGRSAEQLDAASRGVRSLLSFYGSTPAYRPVLDIEGWGDVQPELNALSKRGGYAEMTSLITDPMLETLAVVGTPEECATEIRRRFGEHADEVCCYFPGYTQNPADVAAMIAALG
ncbi:TIGR03617 family F420-dependent LLM class oxidoreductase [Rhodococcus sp. IEGM 1379]|uniref:TIGR03617 family F420-dependent LLM class oxidoreductase n=1 Tax=Rhodococcus sp. IEGM 1379 TaxID=3047086 RepID=UPI0024B79C9A|nr:TIGR03617 family F420-dependent LLM class oxidoreductase [Rhodococcus sp. IEGM 1379]MDI9915099.1 TIGR03617 family F420-dependent LLM class oxidoreductase [Rhodococcus sp. IEGM 1379]